MSTNLTENDAVDENPEDPIHMSLASSVDSSGDIHEDVSALHIVTTKNDIKVSADNSYVPDSFSANNQKDSEDVFSNLEGNIFHKGLSFE